MRRLLIQVFLPLVFCSIPLLTAALIAVAIPDQARKFYFDHVSKSAIDWIILGLGGALFLTQMMLAWRALQWQGTGFNERPDRWLSNLGQAAEWFPMLGLIGTVMAILQTFGTLAAEARQTTDPITTARILELYAPAITATGSGLFMALINLFPTWIVLLGRDLILSLGGGSPPSGEVH
ncbi:MAG: MotA/TolQ/ExbB proton channel family protein [Gemmataceae bacterium]|nr:MotA/TolQ/ExbB proton channel family protein [Gemmataceae bacterium]